MTPNGLTPLYGWCNPPLHQHGRKPDIDILDHMFLERLERLDLKEKGRDADFSKPEAEEPPALSLVPNSQALEGKYPSAQHQALSQDSSTFFPPIAGITSISDRRFPGHFENTSSLTQGAQAQPHLAPTAPQPSSFPFESISSAGRKARNSDSWPSTPAHFLPLEIEDTDTTINVAPSSSTARANTSAVVPPVHPAVVSAGGPTPHLSLPPVPSSNLLLNQVQQPSFQDAPATLSSAQDQSSSRSVSMRVSSTHPQAASLSTSAREQESLRADGGIPSSVQASASSASNHAALRSAQPIVTRSGAVVSSIASKQAPSVVLHSAAVASAAVAVSSPSTQSTCSNTGHEPPPRQPKNAKLILDGTRLWGVTLSDVACSVTQHHLQAFRNCSVAYRWFDSTGPGPIVPVTNIIVDASTGFLCPMHIGDVWTHTSTVSHETRVWLLSQLHAGAFGHLQIGWADVTDRFMKARTEMTGVPHPQYPAYVLVPKVGLTCAPTWIQATSLKK